MIAFTGPPRAEAWPYLIASSLIHCVYWAAVIKGYDAGDLSNVYTLSRGTAPVLVAVGAAVAAREIPDAGEALGIGLVSLGVLCVGVSPTAPLRATMWALITAACIAAYSLVDALGARFSGNVANYFGWMALAMGAPLCAFAIARRGPALLRDVRADFWRGFATGAVSSAGFGIVLWAQTFAPIAHVTALRETSVVFAAFIAWAVLKEPLGFRRWAAAFIVAAGGLLIGFT